MNDPQDPQQPPNVTPTGNTVGRKKPYAPPKILSRESIEGRANVCDPLAGGKATAPSCAVARS